MLRRPAPARLVDALDEAQTGVVLIDRAGRIVAANRRMVSLVPALGTDLAEGADFAAAFRRIAADGLPDAAECELPLADGRWLHLSRSAARDGGASCCSATSPR